MRRLKLTVFALLLWPIGHARAFSSVDFLWKDVHDRLTRVGLRAARIDQPTCGAVALLDEALQLQDGREMALPLQRIQGHVLSPLFWSIDNALTDGRPDACDSTHHFDRKDGTSLEVLVASRKYAYGMYLAAVRDIAEGRYPEAIWSLGAAFHAWQDAYSHSNLAELLPIGALTEAQYQALLVPPPDGNADALQTNVRAGTEEVLAPAVMYTSFRDPPPCAGADCLVNMNHSPKGADDELCDALLLRTNGKPSAEEYTHTCFNKDSPPGGATSGAAKHATHARFRLARDAAVGFTSKVWQSLEQDVAASGGPESWGVFTRWTPPREYRYEAGFVFAVTRGCF